MLGAKDFDMPAFGATFEARGGWLANHLAAEFGLTLDQACGIVGNLGFESGGFKTLQEIAPLAGGAGGYGWAQWTGPRRVAYMSWCAKQGMSPASDQANYGYLLAELHGAYSNTITALRRAKSIGDAVFSVGQTYERPGGTTDANLPGYAGRLAYAQRAFSGAQGPPPIPAAPDPIALTIRALQAELQAAGFYNGALDADPGPQTLAAITAWRNAA